MSDSKSNEDEVSEGGSRIFRHDESQIKDFEMPAESCVYYDQIVAHVEKHIGKVESVIHELVSDQVHIDILRVDPTPERPFYSFITSGMSDRPMTTPEGAEAFKHAELMICLPADWPVTEEDWESEEHYWPIRWLKQLARLPHKLGTWFGWGHTIPNGDPPEPLAQNTGLTTILISMAMTGSKDFVKLAIDKDTNIMFYGIVPIHTHEMEFKLAQGAEALEELFDEAKVSELLQVDRPDLVTELIKDSQGMLFTGYLKDAEQRIGPAPRKVERASRMKKPMWMRFGRDKRFKEIYEQQDNLLANGRLVWGHLIQANSQLFEAGSTDSPANVLYTESPEGSAEPQQISDFASNLFAIKGEYTGDPEVQKFSDLLEDEYTVESLAIPVPPKITGGIQCQFGAIMVCRKHLPGKVLQGGLFPLLILPEKTKAAMILPSAYWDPDFIANWWG